LKHDYRNMEGRMGGRWMRHMRGGRRGHDEQGFEGRRHHGGGGRHGKDLGLRRFFAHGDLRLVVLSLIEEKPRHGYEIIKAIEESVAGAYSPSPGVIYPTLTLLEELGYVTATADGSKKLHSITDEGRAFLEANRTTLDMLNARIAEFSGARGGGRSPQIMRAMENLKMALRLRMGAGPLSPEQIDAIAAAIDAAASQVEKA
jgi:DNA-binding PadR family transcriptional regulator